MFEFFQAAGAIADIKIIRDRSSGRSKGFAYVEFSQRESVILSLALSGQPLLGQPVMVKMSEAEKNTAWEAAQAAKKHAASHPADATTDRGPAAAAAAAAASLEGAAARGMPGRLLVSNLPVNIVEADLRRVFDPFGAVDFLTVQRDGMGSSQGVALVQYRNGTDASVAAEKLNEGAIELAPGMIMRIVPAPLDFNPLAAAITTTGTTTTTTTATINGGAGGGGVVQGSGVLPGSTAVLLPDPSAFEERIDVDADDGGGLRLTAQSRIALMSRLAATAGIEVPQMMTSGGYGNMFGGGGAAAVAAATAAGVAAADLALEQGVLGPASPIPTQCLLLKNMFDPEKETEPQWEDEIAMEVKGECSKFGQVLFVHVDAASKVSTLISLFVCLLLFVLVLVVVGFLAAALKVLLLVLTATICFY